MQRDISYSEAIVLHYCGIEHCAPEHSCQGVRLHYLLHFVVSGKGVFKAEGRTYSLSSGDIFLIKPGESTYYCADSSEPWEYIWIAIGGKEAYSLLRDIGLENSRIKKFDDIELIRSKLIVLLEGFKTRNRYFAIEQLYGIAALLYTAQENAAAAEIYLRNAVSYIENNYLYHIKIEDIAERVGIDRSYLYRLFIEYFKKSPKEYLDDIRIKAAKELLSMGSYTVTEAALSCGFSDASAFSKAFRKAVGITAGEYKKKYSNGIIVIRE